MASLVILTPNPFPIGNVATNRLTTYAKALASIGDDVGIVVLKGTEDPALPLNPHRTGSHDGIWYQYMASSSRWNRNAPFLKKLALYLFGLVRASFLLWEKKPDSVLLYSNDVVSIIYFYVISRIVGFRYLIDKSEYPVVYRSPSGGYRWIYLKSFLLFDGILVMTSELMNYYSSLKKRSASVFMLPMSVDLERFDCLEDKDSLNAYICCVYGVHNRDCIADTIAAFDLFCFKNQSCNLRLKLVGDFQNLRGRDDIEKILAASRFRELIELVGPVNSSDIPRLLFGAQFLITTPRKYESGGFPTKLGEYLATGKLVIATEVGELSNYLTSGENVIFSRSGDIVDIAKSMEFAWLNPEISKEIGRRGRDVARRHFNVHTYMDELRPFLYRCLK